MAVAVSAALLSLAVGLPLCLCSHTQCNVESPRCLKYGVGYALGQNCLGVVTGGRPKQLNAGLWRPRVRRILSAYEKMTTACGRVGATLCPCLLYLGSLALFLFASPPVLPFASVFLRFCFLVYLLLCRQSQWHWPLQTTASRAATAATAAVNALPCGSCSSVLLSCSVMHSQMSCAAPVPKLKLVLHPLILSTAWLYIATDSMHPSTYKTIGMKTLHNKCTDSLLYK